MQIYFVRHADPDYMHNCITPLGHLQAQACAARLVDREITAVYSSTLGRATQTAAYIGEALGMPVTELDFIHEVVTGLQGLTGEEQKKLSPWLGCDLLIKQGVDLTTVDWEQSPLWGQGNRFKESYFRVTEGFDRWIEEALGYRREGPYYRCLRAPGRSVDRPLIVAHGGSIACLIAHFFNVDPMIIIPHVHLRCTGITVFEWGETEGEICTPKAITINDSDHVRGLKITDADEHPQ